MISELTLLGIESRGIANQERIVLKVDEPVNSMRFALVAGVLGAGGFIPYRDQFFWFGNGELFAGDILMVMTGQGEHRADMIGSERLLTLYWGRAHTLFHRPEVVVALMELGDFRTTLPVPPPQPQFHTPFIPSPP